MTPDQVVSHFGGTQVNCAKVLGVDQGTVSGWVRYGVPYRRQCEIQIRTAGALQADLSHAPKSYSAAKTTGCPYSENHNV